MAMPMPSMPQMPPTLGGPMQGGPPMPPSNPFDKFGGGNPMDSMMGGGMPPSAPMDAPMPPPSPAKRQPISKKEPIVQLPPKEPTPQEEVEVADSYDQMIADMINEYRGLFQWQSQWRRY